MKMLLLLAVLVGFGSAAQVCPENQEFKQCGTACPLTCDNYQKPPFACIFVCITGCACKNGFVQKSSGTSNIECVESKDCPNAPTNVTVVPIPINITQIPFENVKECNKSNNEVYSTCASSCVPTCKEPNKDKGICTLACIVGCVCDKGFLKNEQNGECVKPNQCPPADSNSTTLQPLPPVPKCEKANQAFQSCGSACPPTCQDPNPQVCTMDCKIECQCATGYLLNDTGDCVKPQYCPPLNDSVTPNKDPSQECPPGQKWEDCGSACPLKCNAPRETTCTANCVIGCSCVEGLVLNDVGDCVEPSKCPPPSNSSVTPQQPPERKCDKPRQKWDSCGTACPPTCQEPNPQACTKDCKIGCACESGTLLNDQGDCVEAAQCPPLNQTAPASARSASIGHPLEKNCTKPHESFLTCGTACPATCSNQNTANEPCTKNCVIGCFCDGGFVRSPSGDCVEPKDCANKTAPSIPSGGVSANKTDGAQFIWLDG